MLGSCPAPRLGQLFQSQPPCFPCLDVSEKIRPPAEEAVCLVQMLHEVVTSKVFKEAYTDMMVNGGGRWAKLGSQIEQAG